jgi:hypothetical protein
MIGVLPLYRRYREHLNSNPPANLYPKKVWTPQLSR